jgi:hypothetical protein
MTIKAEKDNNKSSNLTETNVPETRYKGNFGKRGTRIRMAATVYLTTKFDNIDCFDIGSRDILFCKLFRTTAIR